ncbi:MAG: lysylphosphatidylglycerol synthase domain-containing protein [Cyanobacteriota bacterium]
MKRSALLKGWAWIRSHDPRRFPARLTSWFTRRNAGLTINRAALLKGWAWIRSHDPRRFPGGLNTWLGLLSLGFVLAALLHHGQGLVSLSLDRQGVGWVVLAVGSAWLSLGVNAMAWQEGLHWLGISRPSTGLLPLFLASNLKKYLPGGGWHLLARVQALRRGGEGLGPPVATSTALLGTVLDPLLMALAALALVPLGGWQGGLLLLGLAPVLLLTLPDRLTGVLSWLEQQKARHLNLASAPLPTLTSTPWRPWLAELGFVVVRFLAFACCIQAFDLANLLGWANWLAAFAVAWTAGLVVPGAPGGLGVFEAALLLRLSGTIPDAPLLAVALTYRLATTAADLLAAGAVHLDRRREPTDRSPGSQ